MSNVTFTHPNDPIEVDPDDGASVLAGGNVNITTTDTGTPPPPVWVQCRLISEEGGINLTRNVTNLTGGWQATFNEVHPNDGETEAELVALLFQGTVLLHVLTRRVTFEFPAPGGDG